MTEQQQKLLQEAKDAVAKENGYDYWNHITHKVMFINEVAIKYNELCEADKWISVYDRRPEKGERILIMHEEFGVQISYLTVDNLWMITSFDVKTNLIESWQPLPQPPK